MGAVVWLRSGMVVKIMVIGRLQGVSWLIDLVNLDIIVLIGRLEVLLLEVVQ